MLRVNLVYVLLFLATVFKFNCTGCEEPKPKSEDVLPPITMEGKNTFGCKVNGKIWVRHGMLNCDWYLHKEIPALNGSFKVVSDNYEETINISHRGIWSVGQYSLDSSMSIVGGAPYYFANATASIYNNLNERIFYRVTPSVLNEFKIPGKGTLNILRLDSITRIISGTFEFTAKNERDSTELLIVTDGRFDVKF